MKKHLLRRYSMLVFALTLVGCAGTQRSCAVNYAQNYGSDWVIAQDDMQGHVARCWIVRGQSVANEAHTDGIYWLDSGPGRLIHISGWYNRAQAIGGDFEAAAHSIGAEASQCQ